jgi:hypothetical protein
MALQGKIVVHKFQYHFEYITTLYDKPVRVRTLWPIETLRTSGYSYASAGDAIGRPATVTDGRVHCYLGNGNSATGTLPEGGATKAVVQEESPVERPKCRSELRWRNGRWEKNTARKGWVQA